MPVELQKTKKRGRATCENCGKVSDWLKTRTAAPELDVCEALKGWAYTIGFFAMLAGPQTMCPECKEKR